MISPWGYLVSWVGQWDMQNMSLSAILTGDCTPGPPQAISCGQSRLGIAEYVFINYSDRGLHPRTPAGDILWAGLNREL